MALKNLHEAFRKINAPYSLNFFMARRIIIKARNDGCAFSRAYMVITRAGDLKINIAVMTRDGGEL